MSYCKRNSIRKPKNLKPILNHIQVVLYVNSYLYPSIIIFPYIYSLLYHCAVLQN